VFLTFLARDSV